jgi:hypothetical protein
MFGAEYDVYVELRERLRHGYSDLHQRGRAWMERGMQANGLP